jgi:hypothetical protein
VHLTCGILRLFRVFFWLRVFPTSQALSTPAHTQVTQTVGQPLAQKTFAFFPKLACVSNWQKCVFKIKFRVSSKISGLPKSVFLAVAFFQISRSQKLAFLFSWQVSFLAVSGFQNWLRGFGQSFW